MKAPNGSGAVYKIPQQYRLDPKTGQKKKVNRRKPWVFRVTTGYEKGEA